MNLKGNILILTSNIYRTFFDTFENTRIINNSPIKVICVKTLERLRIQSCGKKKSIELLGSKANSKEKLHNQNIRIS